MLEDLDAVIDSSVKNCNLQNVSGSFSWKKLSRVYHEANPF